MFLLFSIVIKNILEDYILKAELKLVIHISGLANLDCDLVVALVKLGNEVLKPFVLIHDPVHLVGDGITQTDELHLVIGVRDSIRLFLALHQRMLIEWFVLHL